MSATQPRVEINEEKLGEELTERMIWVTVGTHGYIRVHRSDGTTETFGPGDVDVKPTIPECADVRDRFNGRWVVDEETGCHEWQDRTDRDGYGTIKWNGSTKRAHRIAYRMHEGPIPDGKVIMHLCDRAECVNVLHLELATQVENVTHAHITGARDRPLSDDDVREIRDRYANEEIYQYELADEYGVCQATISGVVNRETHDYIE